ncbi:malate synthase A [Flavobacterium sp. '19STA2R22 D10 B1']|uniref:malate synthase A n=1 Tax=Flavobacterium aerium TaxID=3037261 RepID=UPI00278C603D|nr:malate synthase A [Flavobacterium sp. '19STA2R22 D10 B1']
MENLVHHNLKALDFNPKVTNYYPNILTDEAIAFLIALHKKFNTNRIGLLSQRAELQKEFDQGAVPKFHPETEDIRKGNWVAASIPADLLDRRVEITGPVDRKMIINALNSGAKTFMADFEDSTAPTWNNIMTGQQNLKDAVSKKIKLVDTKKDKTYQLLPETAVLIVRPRGLHLHEKNLLINQEEASASLVDFGLYAFHNYKNLLKNNTAPYFYLPKLEHYLEARWWDEVFEFTEEYLGVTKGTFKATVLIETITASFQLDEIIYELRNHIVGLNCGRWDYIFSYIKKLKTHRNLIVPNRDQVTMKSPFMSAYSKLVIQKCHKRGILAIGGMAAQIPINNNPEANALAFQKVTNDKELEAKNGHDGTWVAHPALVPVALKVFNQIMPTKNQIHIKRADLVITEQDLIEKPEGTVTQEGIHKNINIAILYIASWLNGQGAAALYHLMEDAATAEISRTQLWQWLHNAVPLENGSPFTIQDYNTFSQIEMAKIEKMVGTDVFEKGKFKLAKELLDQLVLNEDFEEFLTLPAYEYI